MKAEELLDFIEKLDIESLSPDEKTKLYTTFRQKILGIKIPATVSQSLSFGGIQIVGESISLNIFDPKIVLDAVEKIVEKDPEFLLKLAEVIAKRF